MTQSSTQPADLPLTLTCRILGVAHRSGFQIRQAVLGTRLRAMGVGIPGLDPSAQTEPVSPEQLAALMRKRLPQSVAGAR